MRRTIREKEPPKPSTRLSTLAQPERDTTAKVRSAEAPRLLSLLKGDLDCIVMKCLEKDRTRRYETANGLAADLQRHLDHEPVVARPPNLTSRSFKPCHRPNLPLAPPVAVVATSVLGTGWTACQPLKA